MLHLDRARHPLGVIRWQAHLKDVSRGAKVQHAARCAHKAFAHALLDDAAHLHVLLIQESLAHNAVYFMGVNLLVQSAKSCLSLHGGRKGVSSYHRARGSAQLALPFIAAAIR